MASGPGLPDSLVLEIFLHLPHKAVLSAGFTCRQWFAVSRDEFLWKELLYNYYCIPRSCLATLVLQLELNFYINCIIGNEFMCKINKHTPSHLWPKVIVFILLKQSGIYACGLLLLIH